MNPVIVLALPRGYESLVDERETKGATGSKWKRFDVPCALLYVEFLAASVAARIQAISSHYRLVTDTDPGRSCWVNHCGGCGVRLDEAEMQRAAEESKPAPYQDWEPIRTHRVGEFFEARAALIALPWTLPSEPSDSGYERTLEYFPKGEEAEQERDQKAADDRRELPGVQQPTPALRDRQQEGVRSWLAYREKMKRLGKALSPEEQREQSVKDWLEYREKRKDSEEARDTAEKRERDRGRGRDDDFSI